MESLCYADQVYQGDYSEPMYYVPGAYYQEPFICSPTSYEFHPVTYTSKLMQCKFSYGNERVSVRIGDIVEVVNMQGTLASIRDPSKNQLVLMPIACLEEVAHAPIFMGGA